MNQETRAPAPVLANGTRHRHPRPLPPTHPRLHRPPTRRRQKHPEEALRAELQPDIRVIVVEPGSVATELAEHITHPDSNQAAEQATAEIGIPAQDIADVIAFAISRPQRVRTRRDLLVRLRQT